MFAIVNVAMQFFRESIKTNPLNEQKYRVIEETFTCFPNAETPSVPQLLPDWVKETEQYQLAVKDEWIVESVQGPKPKETDEENKAEHHKKVPAGLKKWH